MFCVLFIVDVVVLTMPLIPRRRRTGKVVYVGRSMAPRRRYPMRGRRQRGSSYYDSRYLTHFSSPTPDTRMRLKPRRVFITVLFASFVVRGLLQPRRGRFAGRCICQRSLRNAGVAHTFKLHTPPSAFVWLGGMIVALFTERLHPQVSAFTK